MSSLLKLDSPANTWTDWVTKTQPKSPLNKCKNGNYHALLTINQIIVHKPTRLSTILGKIFLTLCHSVTVSGSKCVFLESQEMSSFFKTTLFFLPWPRLNLFDFFSLILLRKKENREKVNFYDSYSDWYSDWTEWNSLFNLLIISVIGNKMLLCLFLQIAISNTNVGSCTMKTISINYNRGRLKNWHSCINWM